jgi:hypothetical protein
MEQTYQFLMVKGYTRVCVYSTVVSSVLSHNLHLSSHCTENMHMIYSHTIYLILKCSGSLVNCCQTKQYSVVGAHAVTCI